MYQVYVFTDNDNDGSAEYQANVFLTEYRLAIDSLQAQVTYIPVCAGSFATAIMLTVQAEQPLEWPMPRWCEECGQRYDVTTHDPGYCETCRKNQQAKPTPTVALNDGF